MATYYCYRCYTNNSSINSDFTCPSCSSGFIAHRPRPRPRLQPQQQQPPFSSVGQLRPRTRTALGTAHTRTHTSRTAIPNFGLDVDVDLDLSTEANAAAMLERPDFNFDRWLAIESDSDSDIESGPYSPSTLNEVVPIPEGPTLRNTARRSTYNVRFRPVREPFVHNPVPHGMRDFSIPVLRSVNEIRSGMSNSSSPSSPSPLSASSSPSSSASSSASPLHSDAWESDEERMRMFRYSITSRSYSPLRLIPSLNLNFGPPPLSGPSLMELERKFKTKITAKHLEETSQCCVCLEDFLEGGEGVHLACKHLFHSGCILSWAKHHSTCPLCRKDLLEAGSRTKTLSESTLETYNAVMERWGLHHHLGHGHGLGSRVSLPEPESESESTPESRRRELDPFDLPEPQYFPLVGRRSLSSNATVNPDVIRDSDQQVINYLNDYMRIPANTFSSATRSRPMPREMDPFTVPYQRASASAANAHVLTDVNANTNTNANVAITSSSVTTNGSSNARTMTRTRTRTSSAITNDNSSFHAMISRTRSSANSSDMTTGDNFSGNSFARRSCKRFTKQDGQDIINFILARNSTHGLDPSDTGSIWRDMAAANVGNNRSSKGLRAHFSQVVLHRLDQYDVSEADKHILRRSRVFARSGLRRLRTYSHTFLNAPVPAPAPPVPQQMPTYMDLAMD